MIKKYSELMSLVLIQKEMLINLQIGEIQEKRTQIQIKEDQDLCIFFEEKKKDKILWL
jgi:hypothetical protein